MRCCPVSSLVEEPLKPDLDHGEASLLGVEADRLGALLDKVDLEVILEVGAHPWQVVNSLDSNLSKLVSVSHTRQLKKLWGIDSSTTEKNLPCSNLFQLPSFQVFDPNCSLALQ